MKTKKIQLDVDFIGGVRTLTIEDKQAISDFIKQHKLSSKKASKTKQLKRKNFAE
ncbi:MAG: hypothetical protein IPI31_06860 [Bacteroidetes bacterium]|jgi:hypothetical protein|nr:hypothetical protein [Bacteroidota bacterium]MBK7567536.1 hypothetical protein [Bacteroidota bacterium]MBP8917527.1 hypothetical protein [Chitinophagales bacterium]MBP9796103.1 hypothetical protein [Chitinophagales bacterium]